MSPAARRAGRGSGSRPPRPLTAPGIFAGLAGYEVITATAAVLIFERVAMLCWPRWWQLPARMTFAPCVERQGPGYRRGYEEGEHRDIQRSCHAIALPV